MPEYNNIDNKNIILSVLHQESSDLKSNANLMSTVGSITLVGGVGPTIFVKTTSKWMIYASICSSIVSILAFSKSIYGNLKARTIDTTLDIISHNDKANNLIHNNILIRTDLTEKELWEEKVKKTSRATEEIQI